LFDIRRFESLVRMNEFGAAHADQFPATSGGGKLFAALDPVVGRLKSHVVTETVSKNAARQGVASKNAAGNRLRQLLTTLTRTAKLVTSGMPGLVEKFRLPRSRSDQRLVAAARAVVQESTRFADAIVAHNLPSTFLADVTTGIDAFEAAIQAHATARESRASAGAGIREELAAGFTIADQLDTVVANQCGADPTMLAEWKAARRVLLISIPHQSRKQPTEPAPTPVPKPA